MPTNQQESPDNRLDSKKLAALITELNIARRNSHSYPPGHPLVEASLVRLVNRYADLMGNGQPLSMAIARDSLVYGDTTLDRNNLVFRDFAKALFQCGIGALTLSPGLTAGELKSFFAILDMKRDEITAAGGIDAVWQEKGLGSLTIRPIRYDLFTASEERPVAPPAGDNDSLWQKFARSLLEGNLATGCDLTGEPDPEQLAAALNRHFAEQGGTADEGYNAAFREMMLAASGGAGDISDKLARFIAGLAPALRQQLLHSTLADAKAGEKTQENEAAATGTIQEVLDQIGRRDLKLSPEIVKILHRLSLHAPTGSEDSPEAGADRGASAEQMHGILRERSFEIRDLADYQNKINILVASRQIPNLQSDELEPLLATIDTHQIENRISAILLELIAADEAAEAYEPLARSLADMAGYFLQTGDYANYLAILEQAYDPTKSAEFRRIILENCTRLECLEEILNGLHVWGKSRYTHIKNLVWKIGPPFIQPLLTMLAEEDNRSLRHFLIERLSEFGAILREPVLARLNDNRWYYLRNLIILLKGVLTPDDAPALRRLLKHPHPRVRQEAYKTLLLCRDQQTERQLLNDLGSDAKETQLEAIRLVEVTKPPQAFGRLLQILAQGGVSAAEVELKCVLVRALGEYGRADALPELTRILFSRNLLYARSLARLKLEIIASLEHYPLVSVQQLLQKCSAGNDDLARKAGDVLRAMMKGRYP